MIKTGLQKIIFPLLLLLCLQPHLSAQTGIAGKTFVAQTGSTCKEMPNGGCTITEYCMLQFSKDNVVVSTYSNAKCTDKKLEKNYARSRDSKTYKWSQQKNTVRIEGFDDYGTFTLNGNTLSGARRNGDAYEMVVFTLRTAKR